MLTPTLAYAIAKPTKDAQLNEIYRDHLSPLFESIEYTSRKFGSTDVERSFNLMNIVRKAHLDSPSEAAEILTKLIDSTPWKANYRILSKTDAFLRLSFHWGATSLPTGAKK